MSVFRLLFFILFVLSSSACTHLHKNLMSSDYKLQETTNLKTVHPKIQIIITRGPFYFTHSAIRIKSNKRVLFWDPSGSYAGEEHESYYKEHPLNKNFLKKNALVIRGVPDLATYWLFAQYTDDLGMEIFEWPLTDELALQYQNVLLAGANEGENEYDFSSQDSFLLCSSALSRFLIRFTDKTIKLNETFFFPDSLAHELYKLKPDRVILFEKEKMTQIFEFR